MHRPTASRKQVLGLALTLTIGTGVGVGLATTWSASGAATPHTYLANTAPVPAGGNAVPGGTGETTTPAPSSAPLTLEEAKAIATQTAPGRVVEWDEDQEPTGLRYDLTVLHADRTTTKVEVDTVTRQITSIAHDNDVWD